MGIIRQPLSGGSLARLLMLGLGTASPVFAEGIDESIEKALNVGGGKINIDIRYRFEYVDQANLPEIAKADMIRARIGYLTPEFHGLKAFAEYEGNQDIFSNEYNSTWNNKTRHPVIADPQKNEVNQLWLNYSGLPQTNLKVGRQRIIFDNHRFIGNVIWRQLEQTYDAVAITNASLPDTTITAGYIWKVQDVTSRTIGMNSPIFNIAYTGLPWGKLVVHGEWLDYDNQHESFPTRTFNTLTNSTQTVGVRFDGATPITDKIKALYTAEYAWQEDYAENPKDFKVDYWLAEGGVDLWGFVFKGSFEELGSDNGQGFRTPLATLHAFQGWADKFLVTPPDGVRDVYGTFKTSLYGLDLWFVYHDFRDDTGSIRYGEEFDVQVEKKFGKHYSLLFKFADYNSSNPRAFAGNVDTQKWWLQAGISF
ncbi:alginate export family protein [Methylocaldum sp. 14B]|uniref:alginate export family protein n=1 Tax=Methylocaldum sp. 14B TaxID=1912213 RepID=UPI00098A2CEC|nr:alginate export family protein [Methylocaldum sp. 14B]